MHASVRGAAALGIAVAAAAGCSGSAVTATHPDSHHSPIAGSCSVRPGWAAITLGYVAPLPAVAVPLGAHIVVTVPRWGTGTATDVSVSRSEILREECTVTLPGGGRRTIFLAAGPGSTHLGATVRPATRTMMPAWSGTVTVRDTQH